MPRRVVETKAKSIDHEPLLRIVVYEEGINKERAKQDSRLCKRHHVLIPSGKGYEFK